MTVKKIACLSFSPTGSCGKIAAAVKASLKDYETIVVNITRPSIRAECAARPPEMDYCIVVFPVYADTMPGLFKRFLTDLDLRGKPMTLITGFGNIYVGRAITDAKKILEKNGNVVVSACGVVTAHSYNGDKIRLAENEPSEESLATVARFVGDSIRKIEEKPDLVSCATQFPKEHMRLLAYLPSVPLTRILIKKPDVDMDKCNDCRLCVARCPSGAIDSTLRLDARKCIRCLACVKACAVGARVFETRGPMLVKNLTSEGKGTKANVFYL